jgi:hypothetical protein
MMYIEADKAFIMNEHHVPFRQIVAEIRLERKGGKKKTEKCKKKNQNTGVVHFESFTGFTVHHSSGIF